MAAPNINSSATVATLKSGPLALTSSPQTIITAAANTAVYVLSLVVSNIHATNSGTITVGYKRSGTSYRMPKAMTVEVAGEITPITKESPLVLEDGDILELTADASSTLEAVVSYVVFS